MPRLYVIGRNFDLTDEAAAPLVAADILYWDTMGGDDGNEPPHLHINPEMPGFDALETAVYRDGLIALPSVQ